jgi:hypothetical protein
MNANINPVSDIFLVHKETLIKHVHERGFCTREELRDFGRRNNIHFSVAEISLLFREYEKLGQLRYDLQHAVYVSTQAKAVVDVRKSA